MGTSEKVTNHAVERYLYRVRGHDVVAIKAAMASNDPKVQASIRETRSLIWKRCAPAIAMSARCLRADGVKYEFSSNGWVITVTLDAPMPSRTSERRSQARMRA
jgi:hypothetical protein